MFPKAVARRCSVKKVFLKISIKSQENRPPAHNFIRKKLWNRYFPVNLAKFLRTSFLQYTSGGLVLYSKWMRSFTTKYIPWKHQEKWWIFFFFLRKEVNVSHSVFLWIFSHLLEKFRMGNFFCAATVLLPVLSSLNLCWFLGYPFSHLWIMLKNG